MNLNLTEGTIGDIIWGVTKIAMGWGALTLLMWKEKEIVCRQNR